MCNDCDHEAGIHMKTRCVGKVKTDDGEYADCFCERDPKPTEGDNELFKQYQLALER